MMFPPVKYGENSTSPKVPQDKRQKCPSKTPLPERVVLGHPPHRGSNARFNSPIKYNFLLFQIWFPLGITLGVEQKHHLVNGGKKQTVNHQFHFTKFKVRPKLERGRKYELDERLTSLDCSF